MDRTTDRWICASENAHSQVSQEVRGQQRWKAKDFPALTPDPHPLERMRHSPLPGAAGRRCQGKARGACLPPTRAGWGQHHCRAWLAGDLSCPSYCGQGQGWLEASGAWWAAPPPQRRTGRSWQRGWQRPQECQEHGQQALRSSWAQLEAPEAPRWRSGWGPRTTGSPH